MKALALALLAAAALLYVAATALEGRHPAFGYLAAFAEAAMVGAMADWFAVVALFRHPLGLPIPHTAIIPHNKDRIGENLAAFICANFLGTPQVLARLRLLDPAGQLARWLDQPRHARQLGGHLRAVLVYALGLLDDERVRNGLRAAVIERLGTLEATPLIGRVLAALTADGRHLPLVNGVLQRLAQLLDDPTLQAEVTEAIAEELKVLRIVGLDQAAARYATEKLVAAIVRLIDEMAQDPMHPQRQRFDAFVDRTTRRLQEDPALRARGAALQRELLAHPALAEYLHGLWSDALGWLRRDLASDESVLQERIVQAAGRLGRTLSEDPAMREWINGQIMDTAPRWIERYREDIRRYIVVRVAEWNAAEMTRELEVNIGRDLQFIRINGTLVGGLVGLAIHALTQLVR